MLKTNLPVDADVTPALWDVGVAKRKAIDLYTSLYRRLIKGYLLPLDDLIDLICYIDLVENEYKPINNLDARKLFEFLINK